MVLKNDKLNEYQLLAFNTVIIISYILYFSIVFGIFSSVTGVDEYLQMLKTGIKVYVSLFLILRFNPFRHVEFGELDRKIAFASGIYLLTTTAFTDIVIKYVDEIRMYFKPKLNNIIR